MRNQTTITASFAAGALALGLLAGCGGGGGHSQTSSTAPNKDSTPREATAPDKPKSEGPLAEAINELKGAGYEVTRSEPGDAQAALEAIAPDEARISIAYYSDPNQAAVVGKQIEGIFRGNPGRGMVEVRGGFLVDVAEERQLKASEKRAVAEVAELVGGAG